MFGWKIHDYDIKVELAKCSNGTVYLAKYLPNDHHVALKKYHLERATKEELKIYAMKFSEILIALIMRDVLSGLEYLHRPVISHRSIKASHILLNQTKAVLTGFVIVPVLCYMVAVSLPFINYLLIAYVA
ncbi:hypothetical protein DOY81_012303 [Sarcophaga bullata]|nr:hypothetical protein DOY81_012303 [Sarcophaga bullata]